MLNLEFYFKYLERKYILCSCHLTITHIKKLISKKIYENFDKYKDVRVFYFLKKKKLYYDYPFVA
jgi:hypothetical protein